MRTAARRDENEQAIIDGLRCIGASVTQISGKGVADLVVGYRGQNYLFEVKDPMKPPSQRMLTFEQEKWHREWKGQAAVILHLTDALQIMGIPWQAA